jgi:hypothetical protein
MLILKNIDVMIDNRSKAEQFRRHDIHLGHVLKRRDQDEIQGKYNRKQNRQDEQDKEEPEKEFFCRASFKTGIPKNTKHTFIQDF